MHTASTPPADSTRPASVLAIAGGYFIAFSTMGRPLTTLQLGRAKLYLSQASLDAALAVMKRRRISAQVVPVVLRVGESE